MRRTRRDHALAVGGTLLLGDLAPACGKPLYLLQLHPVPGRVADHGVEAAGGARALPIRPDAGEGRLPVEEAFPRSGEQANGFAEEWRRYELGRRSWYCRIETL